MTHQAGPMNMKQNPHKTDGSCAVECNPAAPGGSSLGSVMKPGSGSTAGEKHTARPSVPMQAGGGKTEQ